MCIAVARRYIIPPEKGSPVRDLYGFMWIFLALASAFTLAVISLFDKRLLDYHLPGPAPLILWFVVPETAYIIGALAFTGMPQGITSTGALLALLSGLGFGAGYGLLIVGLKADEASRSIAIVQIYPIFVALLSVPLLGETLSGGQWAAISLVVLGAMLVSLPGAARGLAALRPTRATPLLLVSGLLLGVSFFTVKVALLETDFWTVFIYQQVGMLALFIGFARPRVCRQLAAALRRPRALALLLVGEGILPLVYLIGGLEAANLGPISLVSALIATTPLFVFLLATLLSLGRRHLMEETITAPALTLKFAAIAMIVLGVGALSLG